MTSAAACLLLLAAVASGVRVGDTRPFVRRPQLRYSSPTPLLQLRGGAGAGGWVSNLPPWARVMLRLLFPGNPPRERSAPPPRAERSSTSQPDTAKAPSVKGRKGRAGAVTQIHSQAEFDAALSGAGKSKLVVVDFFATWCGPCQQIAPKFEAMAKELSQARFLKVDVDECKDISQKYGVSAMPTFKMIRGGAEVDSMQGADDGTLREKVIALAGKPDKWAGAGRSRQL